MRGQKRSLQSRQTRPSKVMKREEAQPSVIQGKAVSYQPAKVAPKVPEKTLTPKTVGANKSMSNVTQVKTDSASTKKPTATPSAATEKSPAPKVAKKEKVETVTPAKEAVEEKPKRTSGDIKVLTVAQINEQTNKGKVTQESKKTEEKKPEEESGGHSELNELMTNILKEELRDIMDKVWGCLLEQHDTAPEVIAAEKIRHEVSDHLRNALGLNVAKRLLNVFNPLFMKIQFSCRPENGCLTTFLKEHHIKSFKRIASAKNTFAAQVQDIADFDTLCYTKDLKCGSADLKITPCYKFTECPDKLKLKLDDENDDDSIISDDSIFDDFDDEADEIDTHASEEIKDKPNDKANSEKNKDTQSKAKIESVDKKQTKPESQSQTKPTINKNTSKPESDTKTENKNVTNEKKIDVKTQESTKRDVKNVSQTQKVNKSQEVKVNATNKGLNKNNCKVKPKKNSPNNFEVIDEAFGDDELDDADILALLSGGVVLDECGSDEE